MSRIAAVFVLGAALTFTPQASFDVEAANTRTLKLYNTHTKERADIVFKRNGRYDAGGLRKVNQFLRDWRRNEATKMDPKLLDLLWEVHRESGSRQPIHVVSGYRSPVTNAALRKRSRGVAKQSQHTRGRATDFFIPGVSTAKLRKIALKKQVGGVGYYPKSATPFVHLDTGSVRAWPRLSRKQLIALFPDGRTLHLPSDGKPLKGYADAERLERAGKLEKLNSGRRAIASSDEGSGRSFFRARRRDSSDEPPPQPTRLARRTTDGDNRATTARQRRATAAPAASAPTNIAPPAATKPKAPELAPPLPLARPQTAPILVAEAQPAQDTLAEAAQEGTADPNVNLPQPRPGSGTQLALAGFQGQQPENAAEAARIAQAYAAAAAGTDPLAEILRGGQPLSTLQESISRGRSTGIMQRASLPRPMQQPLSSAPPTLTGTVSLASTGDTRYFRHPDQRHLNGSLTIPSMLVVNGFGNMVAMPAVGTFKGRAIAPVAFVRMPAPVQRSAALFYPSPVQ